MTLTTRQGLFVALGAAAALPLAVRFHGAWPVAAVLTPIVVVALLATGERDWRELWRDRVTRLLLAFLVVTALSLPVGLLVFHNLEGVRSFGFQVALVLNFAAGFLLLRRVDDVRPFLGGFVVMSGVAAIAISLYLLPAGILERVHAFHATTALTAVYGWPNSYGVLLAVALVMCLYLRSTVDTTLWRRVYVVLAAGLALCLVLTFSKTGWVVFGVAAWLLWIRHWPRRRIGALVAAAAVGGVVLYFVTNESFHMQVYTLRTLGIRFLIVGSVLRYVNPLYLVFGSGSENLDALLAAHAQEQIVPGVALGDLTTHDEFLAVLIKGGVISLVLFVAAIVLIVLRSRRLAKTGSPLGIYWYAAVWAILASLFAGELLHYWPTAALFWMMAGAVARLEPVAESARAKRTTPASEHAVPA